MNKNKRHIWLYFLLPGIILLAGGLFVILQRGKPTQQPIFVNQDSVGSWGPVKITLPSVSHQVPEYQYQIDPDLPFTIHQKGNTVELRFSSPAETQTVYTLLLTPKAEDHLAGRAEWDFVIRKADVIYMQQQKDGADLWAAAPESGEKRQLTFTNGEIQDYTVSRDGEIILFSVSGHPAGMDIWGIDRSGENMKQYIDCEGDICTNPAFLPDGYDFAFIRLHRQAGQSPSASIFFYSADTQQSKLLYEQNGKGMSGLKWSPDGRFLAFVDENIPQIKIFDRQTEKIFAADCQASETGGWRPDSSGMVFACSEMGEENPCKDLKEINPLTKEMKQSPMFEILKQRDYSAPAWSGDGKWIVFGERCFSDRPTRQLWLVDASTYDGAQITNDALYNFANYHWDPDSSMLVLQRFEMGTTTAAPDILLWRLSTEELEVLAEGGHSPNWLP